MEIIDVDQSQKIITRNAAPVLELYAIAHRSFRQSGMVHRGKSLTV